MYSLIVVFIRPFPPNGGMVEDFSCIAVILNKQLVFKIFLPPLLNQLPNHQVVKLKAPSESINMNRIRMTTMGLKKKQLSEKECGVWECSTIRLKCFIQYLTLNSRCKSLFQSIRMSYSKANRSLYH